MQIQLKKEKNGYLAISILEPEIRAFGKTPLEAVEFLQWNYEIAKEIDTELGSTHIYTRSFTKSFQLKAMFENIIAFKDLRLVI